MEAALQNLFSPFGLLALVIGTALGVFVGSVPGLTGTMLIALVVPLTYGQDPGLAMTFLVSIYVGAVSGGMITATLLRMPGTPASIVTTLDGYPMARNGRPGRALGLGVMASFAGGLVSWIFLATLAYPISILATKLSYFAYFALVLMALALISSIGGKSRLRSLFSGFLGILLSMPGLSPATGQPRLTFGFTSMNDGFAALPVLIGLFAVSQILREIINLSKVGQPIDIGKDSLLLGFRDLGRHGINLLRSSVIGTWIGILPGIGANIGSVTAYSVARGLSRTPEKFGTGHEEGIVSSEAANNGTIGGALIPLLAIGIPGSIVEVVLLGALIQFGLQPGPKLFSNNVDVVYTIIGAVFLANIAMALIMLGSMRQLAKLTKVPRPYLLPVILFFCVIGSFALAGRTFDVWVMLAFGLLGFFLEKISIPLAPLMIGFVLGPVGEKALSQGLQASNGSFAPLFTDPIALLFFLVSILTLAFPWIKPLLSKTRPAAS